MAHVPLRIDVVSDVVCPWCFVGKRQLEQALERFRTDHPGTEIDVRWHPFQLNPGLPAEGVDRAEYLRKKFGIADTERIYANVRRAGAEVGLALDIESIARQPNTLQAHALLEAAASSGCQDALAEALFAAYFLQGRDLTDPSVLRTIAGSAGLGAPAIDRALSDAEAHAEVTQADERARAAGVRGVPCFIVNQRAAVSGAQGADAILEAIDSVYEPG